MNLRTITFQPLVIGLLALMAGATISRGASPAVLDPPNGFKAQSLGATRLAGEDAKLVKLVSRAPPPPFYPKEALAIRQTGRVLLDLLISADGSVKDALVLEEDPLGVGFGDAAVAAARTYKFTNPYGKLVIIKVPTQFAP